MDEKRWWEYYLVRYLLGAITGAVCILKYKLLPTFFEDSAKLTVPYQFLASGIAGFAVCYIASIPILIFHAARHFIAGPIGIQVIGVIAVLLTILGFFTNEDRAILCAGALFLILMYAATIAVIVGNNAITAGYK